MIMKKVTLVIVIVNFFLLKVFSQSVEDAKRYIYYERFNSAKNTLSAIINSSSSTPEAWYLLSKMYLDENKNDSAEIIINKAFETFGNNINPKNDPLLFMAKAYLHMQQGKIADARKEMEDVLNAGRYKNVDALMAAASANIENKNGDANWAIELLQKAAKRDKKNAAIELLLGDAYRKLHDGSSAIVAYMKAGSLDPSLAAVPYREGRVYQTQNNTEIYLEKFTKAYTIDPHYAPAIYQLYYYYYARDTVKAQQLLNDYIANSDPDPHHEVMQTDLYYLSGNYSKAIEGAKKLLQSEQADSLARLYKLLAYSYAAQGDSVTAYNNMNIYFEKQKPEDIIIKDYTLQASLAQNVDTNKTAPVKWYKKALALEQDSSEKVNYMVLIADIESENGNRNEEAMWREKIYNTKTDATNLDLYKWGVALFAAEQYSNADSIFAIYEEKYPDQIYGPLWRAKSNALIDTSMTLGLAVPHYKKLIELGEADPEKNKSFLLSAYGYLGSYEANITKDYATSLMYFEKIIALDADNTTAKKYVEILKDWVDNGKGSK